MSRVIALVVVAAAAAVAYSATQDKSEEQAVNTPENTTASAGAGEAKLDPSKVDVDKVDPEKVDWSKVDWKKRLTPEQYQVMRQAGTERAFTGEYWDKFDDGEYRCASCGLPLFESTSKFDSHCGWPSFDKSKAKNSILELPDHAYGMTRVEVRCRRCGAHLGHIFDDGPTATGMRYCINSASIKFIPEEGAVEEAKAAPAGDAKDAKQSKNASSAAATKAETGDKPASAK